MTRLSDDVLELEMDAVIKDKPEEGFTLVRKKISTVLQPNEVLIKVMTASFCGTDYHIYEYNNWARNRLKLPLTVGHEFSGEIIKIGSDVSRVKVGDIVSAETHITCGECEFCLRGEGHVCQNTHVIGVDILRFQQRIVLSIMQIIVKLSYQFKNRLVMQFTQ